MSYWPLKVSHQRSAIGTGEAPTTHERAGLFHSIRCLEAWRCGSIYCGGDHLGVRYPSHNNDGATHDKDENEKRHSSDDEFHWLHNKPPVCVTKR